MYNYKELETHQVEFVPVAKASEIGNGERILLEVDDVPIILFNIAGKLFAIADTCSHDDGPLSEGKIIGHEIECPRHGAHFDLATGVALTLPAVVDIPAFPVRVEGDEILIGIPIQEELE